MTFATRPSDKSDPTDISVMQPHGVAPVSFEIRSISNRVASLMINKFHYTHNLPSNTSLNFGAYIGNQLQAVTCYGWPAQRNIPYGWFELRRMVKRPNSPIILSKFLAKTIYHMKALKILCLISYADSMQNHHGGIYQATNWIFTGSTSDRSLFVNEFDEILHPRNVYAMFGTSSVSKVIELNPKWHVIEGGRKYRYIMPLNIRKNKALSVLGLKELPYPKPIAQHEHKPIYNKRQTTASLF